MKRLRAWLGVLLIFLFGAVCGSVLTIGVIQKQVKLLVHGGTANEEDPIVGKLRRELKLDGAQLAEVRKIVVDARKQIEAIKQRMQPETRAVLADGETKVRALLRPDQAARFDKLLSQGGENWRPRSGERAPSTPGQVISNQ
ncbi:MAG TPA: hypothetical protein VGO11_13555 [Chthoniobacteraceae bacterium]|jgi:hypothetical protein|nr:hypothetical protein [Chthoniobacteraceae bacterium]